MAINNGNGTVTVQRGDTLSEIARDFGNGLSYQQIASMNGIPNPNLIYVGQVIKISGSGGSSGGSNTAANSNKAIIKLFGIQSNTDNTLFATWEWTKDNTEKYETWWEYDSGDGVWFIASKGTTEDKQSTYSIPSNAKSVKFWVKPIAKNKEGANGAQTPYWTAEWSDPKTWTDATPLKEVPAPSIKIKNLTLTVEWSDKDTDSTHVEFEIYKDGVSTPFNKSPQIQIVGIDKTASYSCNIEAGYKYIARCRGCNGSNYSEWSYPSNKENSQPSTPLGFTEIRASSETSVFMKWEKIDTAESYEIEYATKLEHFDVSDQVQNITTSETSYDKSGLETGNTYFFRLRAVGENNQKSAWSEIASITIGEKPSAPTTWSSTTTVTVGEPLTLYWVHNTVDGSSQTYAELELIINGVLLEPLITIKNTEKEDEKDKTSKCIVDTNTGNISWTGDDGDHTVITGIEFKEGVKIKWRVRTAGVTKKYGDWSTQRVVDVYAPPTLELKMTNVNGGVIGTEIFEDGSTINNPLTSFPFYIEGIPGPKTQFPIGYHVSIRANNSYKAADQVGIEKNISEGDEVYSKYFDVNYALKLEMKPEFIDLQNGINYTLTCTVTMDSGLTSENSLDFTVSWTDELYIPNAEIGYDAERYITYIRPYCESYTPVYHKVVSASNKYSVSDEVIDTDTVSDLYTDTGEKVYVGLNLKSLVYYCILYFDSKGNPIDPVYRKVVNNNGTYTLSTTKLNAKNISKVYTASGEEVVIGTVNDAPTEYCIVNEASLVEDITLSVYRRGFNGGFTEIITGVDNARSTVVTDPHPSLDYARYRIVAISNSTGAVSYYDVPGYPIGEIAAIIQWDEEWSTFDTTDGAELTQPPWTGSLLRLPYNIDISDSNNQDVTLVEYVGRKRPVSYYGTQIGEKSNWSVEIPKEDKETLYALRRLSQWMGDVYVREPSGTGYWASISVSYNLSHCDVTVPVSFTITRVEGGV